MILQDATGLREANTSGMPLNKADAQILFRLLDLHSQYGLRERQGIC